LRSRTDLGCRDSKVAEAAGHHFNVNGRPRSSTMSMAPGFSSEVAPENSPVGGLAISRELDRRLRSLEAVHGA
jgi:hypothetical protein